MPGRSQGRPLLEEGQRVGRYVAVRDADGLTHAIAASAVAAICAAEDGGCVLLLPGGRLMRVERSVPEVVGWFEVGAR